MNMWGRITKIGSPTNYMWTGLWSLRAMWHKMIQFWEIMAHRMLCNENLDRPTSMMTLRKSIIPAVHKCIRQLYKPCHSFNIYVFLWIQKIQFFFFNILWAGSPGSSMIPDGQSPVLGTRIQLVQRSRENIVKDRSCFKKLLAKL